MSEVTPLTTMVKGLRELATCQEQAAARVLFVFSSNFHKSSKTILLMKFKAMKAEEDGS